MARLRSSIEQTRARISALNNHESSALRSLSSYQRQRHNLTVFIAELENNLARMQDTARVVEQRIVQTSCSLDRAETAWRGASVRMLTYRTEHNGLPKPSMQIDLVYRSLTRSLATYHQQMVFLKGSLDSQQALLKDVQGTQQQMLSAKEQERSMLASTITKSKRELQKIRSNKQALEAELQKKQQSARRVRSLINNLVLKEQSRKLEQKQKRSNEDRTAGIRTETAPQREGFRAHSLPWPTTSTSLLHGYGFYKNLSSGTTFENPGIDIKAAQGSRVTCVGRGSVSSVTWLPGYGSLVIVDHGNGFRTVYANLATVSVGNGAPVQNGTMIGTSGENIDGDLVHFEIWYGKERQNPLTYLR